MHTELQNASKKMFNSPVHITDHYCMYHHWTECGPPSLANGVSERDEVRSKLKLNQLTKFGT